LPTASVLTGGLGTGITIFRRWRLVTVRGCVEVRFGEHDKSRCKPQMTAQAVEVCELAATIEEEQVGVEKFTVPTEQPHQQLDRNDIQPKTSKG
jgi:hypothetical protein